MGEVLCMAEVLRRRITHENKEGFKHVKEVTRICLVSSLEGLCKNLDHKGKKVLERFLKPSSERIQKAVLFRTNNVGLIICVDILGDSTQTPGNKVGIRNRIFFLKRAHLTVVTRTSALSGSQRRFSKSLNKLCRYSWKPSTMVSRTV